MHSTYTVLPVLVYTRLHVLKYGQYFFHLSVPIVLRGLVTDIKGRSNGQNAKIRIPLAASANLPLIPDEYGLLKPGEVIVKINKQGTFEKSVLCVRNPVRHSLPHCSTNNSASLHARAWRVVCVAVLRSRRVFARAGHFRA